MSALSSSLIDVVADRVTGWVGVSDLVAAAVSLREALVVVADPRARRGVRYALVTVLVVAVLVVAVCAALAGARSFVAIAEWAADVPAAVATALGIGRRAPASRPSAGCCSGWTATGSTPRSARGFSAAANNRGRGRETTWWMRRPIHPRAIAVDGKTVRGARGHDGRARHLLAGLDHQAGVVLGQVEVDDKTSEIAPAFAPLLDSIDDLADVVITADALHTQREHTDYLAQRGAHWVFTVKANQPTLRRQLAELPWKHVPIGHHDSQRRHGRREIRTVKVVAIDTRDGGIAFPRAVQALQITRKTRPASGRGRWRTETVYAITDLAPHQANPAELAAWVRGHWHIEALHWVRDVTFAEDHSQIRTGSAPQVMATLRNLVISLLCLTGTTNIAAALRHHARDATRPLATLGIT